MTSGAVTPGSTPPRLKDKRLIWSARGILLLALLLITWLSLMPVSDIPITTFWDKADHAAAFFALSLLAAAAFPRSKFRLRLAPMLLAYGVGIELAQSFTVTRSASLLDVVADLVGILLFGALLTWWQRRSAA